MKNEKTVYIIMEETTGNMPRMIVGCYADKELAKRHLAEWADYVGAVEKPRGRYKLESTEIIGFPLFFRNIIYSYSRRNPGSINPPEGQTLMRCEN